MEIQNLSSLTTYFPTKLLLALNPKRGNLTSGSLSLQRALLMILPPYHMLVPDTQESWRAMPEVTSPVPPLPAALPGIPKRIPGATQSVVLHLLLCLSPALELSTAEVKQG